MTDLLAAIGLIAIIVTLVLAGMKVIDLFTTVDSLRRELKWQQELTNSELQNLTKMWVGHDNRLKVLEGTVAPTVRGVTTGDKEKPDELL